MFGGNFRFFDRSVASITANALGAMLDALPAGDYGYFIRLNCSGTQCVIGHKYNNTNNTVQYGCGIYIGWSGCYYIQHHTKNYKMYALYT